MISAALSCFDIPLLPVQYVRGARALTRWLRGSLQGQVTNAVLIMLHLLYVQGQQPGYSPLYAQPCVAYLNGSFGDV